MAPDRLNYTIPPVGTVGPTYATQINDALQKIDDASVFSVKAYGATGNGTTNDAPAIQAAIDAAVSASGGIVFFPRGIYLLGSGLTVNGQGVTLKGVGWHPPQTSGSVLKVSSTSIFPITITERGVQIADLAFHHVQPTPAPGWAPSSYQFTIRVQADDCYINNVLLLNPTKGIQVAPSNPALSVGRCHINRLFGQPLQVGIELQRNLDVCRVSHVHFWDFWSNHQDVHSYMFANAVAIQSGRSDNPQFSNVFCLWYKNGFRFFLTTGTNSGPTKKFKITDADLDGVFLGILIEGANTTGQIVNLTQQGNPASGKNSIGALRSTQNAQVFATNFRSTNNANNGIRWERGDLFVDNVWIENWNTSGDGFPGIEAVSPGAVTVGRQRFFTGAPPGSPFTGGSGTISLDP